VPFNSPGVHSEAEADETGLGRLVLGEEGVYAAVMQALIGDQADEE